VKFINISEFNTICPFIGVLPIEVVAGDVEQNLFVASSHSPQFKRLAAKMHVRGYGKEFSVFREPRNASRNAMVGSSRWYLKVLIDPHNGIDFVGHL
jgi:hypothetical protein